MYKQHKLPPIVMVELLIIIDNILSIPNNVALNKINNDLTVVKNCILTFYYAFIDELILKIFDISISEPIVINIGYNVQPEYNLHDILNERCV